MISILTQLCQSPNASKIKLGVRQSGCNNSSYLLFCALGLLCLLVLGFLLAGEVVLSLEQGLIRFSSMVVQQPVLQGPGPAWGSPQLQRVVYCQSKEKKKPPNF